MSSLWKPSPTLERDVRASVGLNAALTATAEVIAEAARAIAPVGDPSTDPHSGEYRDGIRTETTAGPGGTQQTRVVADSDDAGIVEYGNSKTPAHATLRRAARLSK